MSDLAHPILEAAGYQKGGNGIFQGDGKPLSFTIANNGGFSDWVASVNVAQSDLKAVGTHMTPHNLSNTTVLSSLSRRPSRTLGPRCWPSISFPSGGASCLGEAHNFLNHSPGTGWHYAGDVLTHAALPAMTIPIASIGGWILTTRNKVITVLADD